MYYRQAEMRNMYCDNCGKCLNLFVWMDGECSQLRQPCTADES